MPADYRLEERGRVILRKLEDGSGFEVDALLGSLSLGVKDRWLVGKDLNEGPPRLNFALKYCVIEPGKSYPMLPSQHNEALFILDGSGLVSNASEKLEVKAGDLVVTGCGEMHSVTNSGKTDLKTLSCIDLLSHA